MHQWPSCQSLCFGNSAWSRKHVQTTSLTPGWLFRPSVWASLPWSGCSAREWEQRLYELASNRSREQTSQRWRTLLSRHLRPLQLSMWLQPLCQWTKAYKHLSRRTHLEFGYLLAGHLLKKDYHWLTVHFRSCYLDKISHRFSLASMHVDIDALLDITSIDKLHWGARVDNRSGWKTKRFTKSIAIVVNECCSEQQNFLSFQCNQTFEAIWCRQAQ